MNKQILKSILTITLCISMMIITVTGCTQNSQDDTTDTDTKPAMAFAVANTANNKKVDPNSPMIQESLNDCCEKFGYTFIVRIDGNPELVSTYDSNVDERYKSASEERLKLDAQKKAKDITDLISGVKPKYEEIDFLEGLRISAASLNSLDESYTSRSIICLGSGLSTTGYMNFQNDLLQADAEEVVKALKEEKVLPNLEGITVYWEGLNQVTDPQPELSPQESEKLKVIWQSVIEACGGRLEINDYISVATDQEAQSEALPKVSLIEVQEKTPIGFNEAIVLDESSVSFKADTDEYLDEKKAVETIRPIAESLKNNSIDILVVGCTAGDTNSPTTLQLSQERADTVKNSLNSLGIDNSRITAIGLGNDDPWHIDGGGVEGDIASQNRKVVILNATSNEAKNIMSNMN